jgi:hypothetical protein
MFDRARSAGRRLAVRGFDIGRRGYASALLEIADDVDDQPDGATVVEHGVEGEASPHAGQVPIVSAYQPSWRTALLARCRVGREVDGAGVRNNAGGVDLEVAASPSPRSP